MSNGNTAAFEEMRDVVRSGKPVDIDTRDRLLFAAIIDIYKEIEKLQPVIVFYKWALPFATALGLALLALLWAVFTGQAEITFK